jgi:hypothetical protein
LLTLDGPSTDPQIARYRQPQLEIVLEDLNRDTVTGKSNMFGDAIGPVDDADPRLTRKPEPSDEAVESRINEEYTDHRLGPKLCRFTRLEA